MSEIPKIGRKENEKTDSFANKFVRRNYLTKYWAKYWI